MTDTDYEAPTVREYGSVEEITETAPGGPRNKIGSKTDEFTSSTNLTGSVIT